jgi:hypothetical protein
MKVYKGLGFEDQKCMFENVLCWDTENGDKPAREQYKEWVLGFFTPEHIDRYISNMMSDINLTCNDDCCLELNESYKRQIDFLRKLID